MGFYIINSYNFNCPQLLITDWLKNAVHIEMPDYFNDLLIFNSKNYCQTVFMNIWKVFFWIFIWGNNCVCIFIHWTFLNNILSCWKCHFCVIQINCNLMFLLKSITLTMRVIKYTHSLTHCYQCEFPLLIWL